MKLDYKRKMRVRLTAYCMVGALFMGQAPTEVMAAPAVLEDGFSKVYQMTEEDLHFEVADDPMAGRMARYAMEDELAKEANKNASDSNVSDGMDGDVEGTSQIAMYGIGNYNHQNRFSEYEKIMGIDVSYYQRRVNWQELREEGIEFIFARLGFRGYGASGTLNMDDKFHEHMQKANAVGMGTGIYFYSQAITPEEAREEARFVLNNIGGEVVSMPIAMDFEYAEGTDGRRMGRLHDAHLDRQQTTDVIRAFLDTINEAGYEAILYASKAVLESEMYVDQIDCDYQIWMAHYTSMTTYRRDFAFWQCSSKEKIRGNYQFDGSLQNTDLDFWYVYPGEDDGTGDEDEDEEEETPEYEEFTPPELEPMPVYPDPDNLAFRAEENEKYYWYENGVRQGTVEDPQGIIGDGTNRGREIYDPTTNAWFWLDSRYNGARAASKEVWVPYVFQDEDSMSEKQIEEACERSNQGAKMAEQVKSSIKNKTGKWIRYDINGKMYKGWYVVKGSEEAHYEDQIGNVYYYDEQTGLMAKGKTEIHGKTYYFDEITGVLQK